MVPIYDVQAVAVMKLSQLFFNVAVCHKNILKSFVFPQLYCIAHQNTGELEGVIIVQGMKE